VLQKSNVFKEHNVDLVDLSQQMLDATYNQYGTKENIRFFCAEILSYLEKTDTIYDFAYALWSLSHSLHQLIGRVGEEDGTAIINATLEKFITRNIRSKGQVFIIHFDSLSPEQQISMDIRRRKYPFYRQGEQSPSKQILDKTFQQLSNKGIIRWSCSHFVGNPIIYDSMEEALEVFFNFHMECEFNSDPRIDSYINRVEYLLAKNQEADGKIRIAPGCFIYVIDRL
jgi:hypothetical protein